MTPHYTTAELTVSQVLARHAAATPDKTLLTELYSGQAHSYRQVDRVTTQLADGIASLGPGHGSHVALFMQNSGEHIFAFIALAKLGAVSVPINTAARGELLRYFLHQSDVVCAIVDAALVPRLLPVLNNLPHVRDIVVNGAEPSWEAPAGHSVRWHRYELVLAAGDAEVELPQVRCSDLLMLAYTSGTTGPSKGNMVSHAAALTYGTSSTVAHGYRPDDVFYVCLPLFHNNALLAGFGAALGLGASMALQRRFSVSSFWSDVRESGATITNLLGSMCNFLWSQPAADNDLDNKLRLVSMAPTPRYARAFEERFGLRSMNNYGMSDFGMATAFTEKDPVAKLGSIGRVRQGVEIRIVDENDFPVAPGETGEILLRSEEPWRASSGYYKMPEATVAAMRNFWFHTGDRGYCDSEGYYYFVDRKKDCIRRRGENVSAYEVEQVISTHPAVENVAVFPVAIDGDEEVAAAIVLRPGAAATESDIVHFCKDNLSYFMVPRFIELGVELPLTSNHKVEKYRLRSRFEGDLTLVWDREQAGIALPR